MKKKGASATDLHQPETPPSVVSGADFLKSMESSPLSKSSAPPVAVRSRASSVVEGERPRSAPQREKKERPRTKKEQSSSSMEEVDVTELIARLDRAENAAVASQSQLRNFEDSFQRILKQATLGSSGQEREWMLSLILQMLNVLGVPYQGNSIDGLSLGRDALPSPGRARANREDARQRRPSAPAPPPPADAGAEETGGAAPRRNGLSEIEMLLQIGGAGRVNTEQICALLEQKHQEFKEEMMDEIGGTDMQAFSHMLRSMTEATEEKMTHYISMRMGLDNRMEEFMDTMEKRMERLESMVAEQGRKFDAAARVLLRETTVNSSQNSTAIALCLDNARMMERMFHLIATPGSGIQQHLQEIEEFLEFRDRREAMRKEARASAPPRPPQIVEIPDLDTLFGNGHLDSSSSSSASPAPDAHDARPKKSSQPPSPRKSGSTIVRRRRDRSSTGPSPLKKKTSVDDIGLMRRQAMQPLDFSKLKDDKTQRAQTSRPSPPRQAQRLSSSSSSASPPDASTQRQTSAEGMMGGQRQSSGNTSPPESPRRFTFVESPRAKRRNSKYSVANVIDGDTKISDLLDFVAEN